MSCRGLRALGAVCLCVISIHLLASVKGFLGPGTRRLCRVVSVRVSMEERIIDDTGVRRARCGCFEKRKRGLAHRSAAAGFGERVPRRSSGVLLSVARI